MIKWKRVGENIPTNQRNPNTSYVSCLVWVCNKDYQNIKHGIFDEIRWDIENKCWLKSDMKGKWIYQDDDYEITHFCDNINIPAQ